MISYGFFCTISSSFEEETDLEFKNEFLYEVN